MKLAVWITIAVLLVLHQDNWNWNSDYMVFGFMPIGLFYHACISMAAGITWYLATIFCWPAELAEAKESAK